MYTVVYAMVKVLGVIPTLKDDPTDTINSILAQTISVSQILVVVGSKRLYNTLTQSRQFNSSVRFLYVRPDCKRRRAKP